MRKKFGGYLFSGLVCSALFIGAVAPMQATSFSVMNTEDAGPGSFRAVLQSANAIFGDHEIILNCSCENPKFSTDFLPVRRDLTLNTPEHVIFALNKKLSGTASFSKKGRGVFSLEGSNDFKGNLIVSEGILRLKAANYYTGDTTIERSCVEVSHPRGFSNGSIFLKDKAQVKILKSLSVDNPIRLVGGEAEFNVDIQGVSLGGVISGEGRFNKQGAGALAIKGANTYQGSTTISEGSLSIQSLQNLGNNQAPLIIGDGALEALADILIPAEKPMVLSTKNSAIHTGDHTVTILGSLKGEGGLQKRGSGTLVIKGNNTFPEATVVHGGTLMLEGVLKNVVVKPHAIFTGPGKVEDLTNEGKIFSIASLTVQGDFDQTSTGVFTLQIQDTGASHSVNVQKKAFLDGKVVIAPIPGHYPSEFFYPVLKASGGIVGTFNAVAAPAQFSGKLEYNAHDVQYHLGKFISIKEILGESVVDRGSGHKVPSDNALIAEALDRILPPPGSDMDQVIANLLTLKDDLPLFTEALSSLQPAHFAALGLAQQSNIIMVRSSLFNRMQDLLSTPCANDWLSKKRNNVWLEAVGDFSKQDNLQSDKGYLSNTAGAVAGLDHGFGNHLQLGFSTAFSHSHVNWESGVGKGRINSFYGSLYGLYHRSFWYVEAAVIGGYNRYNAFRNIPLVDRTASHSNNGYNISGELGFGFLLMAKKFQFQPFAIFDLIHIFQDGFTETGAQSLDLVVGNKKFGMFRSELGLTISRCFQFKGSVLAPDLKLSYIYELQLDRPNFNVHYEGASVEYYVIGMKPNRNLFSPGFGLRSILFDNALTVALYYNAEIGSTFVDQRVSAHLGYSW